MMKKLINPFCYLPLRQAICWGVVAMILTAIFNWQCGLRATSLTQVDFGGGTLLSATVRQVVLWITFSVILFALGVAASKSKVRFSDVAAFNLFARIPFDLSLLMFAVPTVKSIMGYATDGNIDILMQHMSLLAIVGFASALFSIWYFIWSYKAFAEATNVKNGKGVAIFILCYILAYLLTGYVMKFL